MLSKKKSSKMDLSDERATTLLAQQGKIILEGEERLKQLHKKIKTNDAQADKRPREKQNKTALETLGLQETTKARKQNKKNKEARKEVQTMKLTQVRAWTRTKWTP